jgi:catabolite regulation protein CreA
MMNRRLPFAAILLSLLVLPAHAGTVGASMEVSFVVKAACTVEAAPQGSVPNVSCNDASPYRVAPAAAAAQGNGEWTVTF